MFSILIPGKDLALSSIYCPISLLDSICKLFEKILRSRNLYKVSGRGLLHNEQFGFRTKHSTALQLTRLVETANIDCKSTTPDRMTISKEITAKQKIIPMLISSFPPCLCLCLTSLTPQHHTSIHAHCTCMHHTHKRTHTQIWKWRN
jgi:hypothetical protein